MTHTISAKNSHVLSFRNFFFSLVNDESFIQRMLIHMINHRVQEFSDPLTSTIVLMATTPIQIVFCETGLLLFKTNLLPVIPYSLLHHDEKNNLYTHLTLVCVLLLFVFF